jgi:phenylalanyl-tRNA synthetase beta chain
MPTVSLSLDYLERLTQHTPEELERLAFEYGLEATIIVSELEVEVTAERPDLLSAEGLARVFNSYTGQAQYAFNTLGDSGLRIIVRSDVQILRPYIGGLVVEKITLDELSLESIIQFQDKVSQTFGRQRKKIAIGLYDLAKIEGNIEYTSENLDTLSFVPLRGTEVLTARQIMTQHPTGIMYADALPNSENVPVLRDAQGKVLSMPPIINSDEVGNITPSVRGLFVDVTGTSQKAVLEILNIIACNFLNIGAQVKTVTTEYLEECCVTPDLRPRKFPYSSGVLNRLLGSQFTDTEIRQHLSKMDLNEENKNVVLIPPYRTDILSEVDIAGDLLVSVGLNNLKPDLPNLRIRKGNSDPLKDITVEIGSTAQRMGLIEVKSFILTDPDQLSLFSSNYVQTGNAKSRTYSAARLSLQPGLLQILSQNITAPKPLNIYETGEVLSILNEESVQETIFIGFASLDTKASFTLAKSYIQTLLKSLKVPYTLSECDEERYIPGRAAYVLVDGCIAGHFGEIHPRILNYFSFPESVCSGELDCKIIHRERHSSSRSSEVHLKPTGKVFYQ